MSLSLGDICNHKVYNSFETANILRGGTNFLRNISTICLVTRLNARIQAGLSVAPSIYSFMGRCNDRGASQNWVGSLLTLYAYIERIDCGGGGSASGAGASKWAIK
jgi:hypothetical protein